jgi:hypothetical protein
MTMKKITISPEDLKRLIKEEASKILKEESGKIIDAGDTMDVNMNQLDRVDNSDGSAFTKSTGAGKFEKKKANMSNEEIPTDVRMNQKDKDQGHDEKIATAVKVDAANSTKKGTADNPHIEGMKNSNFNSKKGNQSTKASTPYSDRNENVDMNSQDKEGDKGAKTYVEAGADITGREKHTTGQKKAVSSEAAKNEKETYERIADGIELPEGFKNRKELLGFINENAKKASKILKEDFMGFGKDKKKASSKQAIESVLEYFKDNSNHNLYSLKRFLMGDNILSYPSQNINDVYDSVEGTSCEKKFKSFAQSLTKTYREKLPEDTDDSHALRGVEIGEYDIQLYILEMCMADFERNAG